MARAFHEAYQEVLRAKISQAVAGLNKIEPSAITEVSEKFLAKAAEPDLPLDEVKSLLTQAVFLSTRLENSIEPPELQVRGGLILFERADMAGARELWEEAAKKFDAAKQNYRLAVVCLALGHLDLFEMDRPAALVHWKRARYGFGDSLRNLELDERRKLTGPLDEKIKWLKEALFELTVEEALLPEKVVDWFSLYDPVSLNRMMGKLVEKLYAAVAAGDVGSVKDAAKLAEEIAPKEDRAATSALLMAHAGAALLMVGETCEARRFLQHGAVFSSRRSHQEAVTLWLKALAEWMEPTLRKDAVTTSRVVIEAFSDLELWADHHDLQKRRIWYSTQRIAIVEGAERLFNLFLLDLFG